MIGEVESVDEVEIIRRMTEGIYDRAEYKKALAWVKEKCRPDFDKNPVEMQKTPAQKEKDWEFTAKMACIIKDLFNGNKKLPKGREEEMVGHNAIVGGFQGQRQWTDFYPNCDFPESILNSSFDRNGAREPYILGTENDTLNATSMLFMKLLTGRAQIITMCSMLRIPVCMHNVCEDDIYRPAAWNAFGMDKEGQDYRACEAYGPMYKT